MILHTYIQYEFKCMHVNQTRLRRSRDIYTPYILYVLLGIRIRKRDYSFDKELPAL